MAYKDKEKRNQYLRNWNRENCKGFYIKLMKSTDSDIIDMLEKQENKQAYIKNLIRADIGKEN